NAFERLTKANGLSDVDAIAVFYGKEQKTLVIPYLNSNLDIIVNGVIQNFPYIKSASIAGDKSVNHAYFLGDSILLSTGFGIVVYNWQKKESPASYFFIDPETNAYISVNTTIVYKQYIYAATDKGVYRASLTNQLLENFANWEKLSGELGLGTGAAQHLAQFNNRLYAVVNNSYIYEYDGISWLLYYYDEEWQIQHMSSSASKLIVTQISAGTTPPAMGRILTVDINDTFSTFGNDLDTGYPFAAIMDDDKVYWMADLYAGVVRYDTANYTRFLPNGPSSAKVMDMEYYDNALWVAPGEINNSWNYQYNRDGFFIMDYGYWNNINLFSFPVLDTVLDFITMTIDARTGKAYFGSFGGGVAEFDKSANTLQVFNHTNTGVSGLDDIGASDPGSCRIAGMQFDVNGNLWISNFGVENPLVVRKPDGTWKNFPCYLPSSAGNQTAQIVIDDFDQKWIQIPRGTGILVYNHGSTIDDTSDDATRLLSTGAGNGNLPVGYVNCLAKDMDGEIWVGTNEGVAVFYNP
ncbi:MAG: two-component regulator propeller domain-containing protein, partial [Chitinophagales bacterium]